MYKYSNDEFRSQIYDIVKPFWNNERNPNTKEIFEKGFDAFVISRLDVILSKAKYFYIENSYVETEWKDMISLHYVHTSYHFDNDVIRVHFFDEDEINSGNYLGFITLRRINEIRSMLSFIYPNFDLILNEDYNYIIKYEKKVHINEYELTMHTYPCLVQDGVAASCVHVNILTMSLFLHNRHALKKITLKEIEKDYTYRKFKQYPTRGLFYTQILEIFENNRLPINSFMVLDKSDKEKMAVFEKYINVYIESGIPVMLGLKEHVIQIIGHELNNGKYKYIIYDDSGILLREIKGDNSFLATLEWEDIKNRIEPQDFIVAPEYEKIFMSWESFYKFFKQHIKNKDVEKFLFKLINERNRFCDRQNDTILLEKMRMLFVENKIFKSFLESHIISPPGYEEEYNKELEYIRCLSKPHYLWYSEIKIQENIYMCFIADPTYSQYTISNIFINSIPLYIDKPLSTINLEQNKR